MEWNFGEMTLAAAMYANAYHAQDSSTTAVAIWILSALAAGALALLPIAIARRRRARQRRPLRTAALFWSVAATVVSIYAGTAQLNWSGERALRMQSGYYDPSQDDPDAPRFPWLASGVIVCGYCALLGWALFSAGEPARQEPIDLES